MQRLISKKIKFLSSFNEKSLWWSGQVENYSSTSNFENKVGPENQNTWDWGSFCLHFFSYLAESFQDSTLEYIKHWTVVDFQLHVWTFIRFIKG